MQRVFPNSARLLGATTTALLGAAMATTLACSSRDVVARALSCDLGTTSTAWASACPVSPAVTCLAGTWAAVGSPNGDDALLHETAHFAIYSNGTATLAQAEAAGSHLESTVWPTFLGNPVFLPEPYCASAAKHKTSVMIRSGYGLSAGAWGPGSAYMGIWIGPSSAGDHWGLAFLFAGALQAQYQGLSCAGSTDACSWIHDSHANFLAHQLPEFRSNVHCTEMLFNAPHLHLGSSRDRYCNWQFLEYLKDRYCFPAVSAIWEGGAPSDDPFGRIASARGWSTSQLNDFLGEWALHNVTWDYRNPEPAAPGDTADPGADFRTAYGPITDRSAPERRLRLTALEPLDPQVASNRRFFSPWFWAPQRWGYNVVRLFPDPGAARVTVTFRGVTQGGADSDWRWGLVATDPGLTRPRYSALQRGADAELTFCVSGGEELWLVVMATPSVQQRIAAEAPYPAIYRYPYLVQLDGAWPEGFRSGTQDPCPDGLQRHPNGGGCAPPGLDTAVYVGPYALVSGGALADGARIEEHAAVLSGTVSAATVGGLSTLSGIALSGAAVARTTFYPLGYFEAGQSLSGTALLYGDVELRGTGLGLSSGSYCGFVDAASAGQSIADATVAPPYTWRP